MFDGARYVQHLAEPLTISSNVVPIVCKLGQLAIQNQLACHLLRQESWSMLRFLFQTIVGRLSFLISQNVGSSDFLLECFV